MKMARQCSDDETNDSETQCVGEGHISVCISSSLC